MSAWAYSIALVVSLAGLIVLDRRYKLAFFHNWRRAALTLGSAVLFFIIWDLAGIRLGIFYAGSSPFLLPFRLMPQFPIEEVLFLSLLCYTSLLIYRRASHE